MTTTETQAPLVEIGARHHRTAEIIPLPADIEDREAAEVEISFSSETPYTRATYTKKGELKRYHEVLGHGSGEPDFSTLMNRAPVLKDHINRIDFQVGTVTRAWVEGGKGRAAFRFHDTPDARALQKRVLSGEVTNVSVGYDITDARPDGESDGMPVVRVTRWVPYEVSFVASPADSSVGFGRSSDDTPPTIPLSQVSEVTDMTTTATTTPAADPAAPTVDAVAIRADVEKAERARIADITAMGRHHDVEADKIDKAIRSGESAGAFGQAILADIASGEATRARESKTEIGLTDRERKDFSLVRLLRTVAAPGDKAAAEAAAFELEVCRTGAKEKGSTRSDLSIPTDVLATWGRRDASPAAMNTGVAADGGALVPVEHRGNMFVEGLTEKSSIMRAGVTMLTGLQGDVDIPKEISGGTAYWLGETGTGSDATESTPQVGTFTLARHGLAIAIPYTRAMRLQADPSVEAMTRRMALRDFARKLDKTALVGDASAFAPNGLLDFLTPTTWDTANTPTWDEVVEMQADIEDDDADLNELKFICRGRLYHKARQTPLDAGSGQFLAAGGEIDGVPAIRSNQAGAGQLFLGAFEQMIVGFWSGLDIFLDTTTYAASNGHVVRMFQDADIQLFHEESFKVKQNA